MNLENTPKTGGLSPGDVVLVRGRGPVAWAIRLFSWGWWRGEERTRWNHVGLVEGPANGNAASLALGGRNVGGYGEAPADWTVIESTMPRVRRNRLSAIAEQAEAVEVWRYRHLGEIQQGQIVVKAREYLGRRYPIPYVIAHAIDGLLGGWYLTRRLIPEQGRYGICSWLVAYPYDAIAGYRFLGKHPDWVQPDDIGDDVAASPDWAQACSRFNSSTC